VAAEVASKREAREETKIGLAVTEVAHSTTAGAETIGAAMSLLVSAETSLIQAAADSGTTAGSDTRREVRVAVATEARAAEVTEAEALAVAVGTEVAPVTPSLASRCRQTLRQASQCPCL